MAYTDQLGSCFFSLENLAHPQSCGCNGAGVKKIWMIPHYLVTEFNAKHANSLSSFADYVELEVDSNKLTFNTKEIDSDTNKRAPFINVYSAKDLGELKYTVQGNVGGRSLKASLEFTHPSFKKQALGWFNQYMNTELVVIVLLNNGEYHVLGDADEGATFADGAEGTSGKASTDQVGFTPTIEWNTCTAQVMGTSWSPSSEPSSNSPGGIPFVEGTTEHNMSTQSS